MRSTRHEILSGIRSHYGKLPGVEVYAESDTLEGCREKLGLVLEEWVRLRLSRHLPLPTVDGVDLRVRAVA